MMLVRLALLHYPNFSEDFSSLVRKLLNFPGVSIAYLEDGPCEGHRYVIEEKLRQACDYGEMDWILTVGGTWPALGPSESEIMPLATASVLERTLTGITESLRAQAFHLQPRAMLDNGVAGIRGTTFLLNLPSDADLISSYLQTLRPVAVPLLQLLQNERTAFTSPRSGPAPDKDQARLREKEFAAFLKKGRTVTSDLPSDSEKV